MFKKYSPLVLASLLGIGAFALPASTASAAALPYVQQNAAQTVEGDTSLLQEVGYGDRRRGGYGKWKGHHGKWKGYGRYNKRHRGHYGYGRHRGHHGFRHYGYYAAPLIIGGAFAYGGGYGSYGGSHGEWCARRYNSYDWGSNTWVSYGGQVRRCRSPYRY